MQSNSVTYICFVRDHSGSMEKNIDAAISNFNEQRAKLLKEDDETMDNIVTIVEFDDEIHCNIDAVPINEIDKLGSWWVGGMTSLYDAIAYGITLMKERFDKDTRTDKAVLVIVQTDGDENNSIEYYGEEGRLKIKKMIDELEATKHWSFVFLGEDIEKKVAMDIGFKSNNIMSHGKTEHEVRTAYTCSTSGLGEFLKSRKRGETYTMNYFNDNTSKTNDEE